MTDSKKPTKTKNETLSDDLAETVKDWEASGYKKWTKSLKELPDKTFIRYITQRNGEIKARLGGVMFMNNQVKGYLMLRNTVLKKSFPVQYKDVSGSQNPLVGVYLREETKKKAAEPVEEQTDTDEMDKQLKRLFYDEGNQLGRDSFFDVVRDAGLGYSRKQVDEWLKNQEVYQLTKPAVKSKGVQSVTSKAPLNVVEMDNIKFGDFYILNVVDVYSRKAWSEIVGRSVSATNVRDALRRILARMPTAPKTIISDNGPEFSGAQMKAFTEKEKIRQVFGVPGSPQGQGIIERFNGTLKSRLDKALLTGSDFDPDLLNKVVNIYNNTRHSTTKQKPEAVFSGTAEPADDAKTQNLDAAKQDDLSPGDLVRVAVEKNKIGKTPINWSEELFKVAKVVKPSNPLLPLKYKIETVDGEPVRGYLSRVALQKVKKVEGKKPAVVYEVEKLLGKRKEKRKVFYLVKWKGYSIKDSTWEPETELIKDGLSDLIDEFNRGEK